jgi:hypothetical protein
MTFIRRFVRMVRFAVIGPALRDSVRRHRMAVHRLDIAIREVLEK